MELNAFYSEDTTFSGYEMERFLKLVQMKSDIIPS